MSYEEVKQLLLFYSFLRVFVSNARREGKGVNVEVVGVDDMPEFCTPMLQGLDMVTLVFQFSTEVGYLFVFGLDD